MWHKMFSHSVGAYLQFTVLELGTLEPRYNVVFRRHCPTRTKMRSTTQHDTEIPHLVTFQIVFIAVLMRRWSLHVGSTQKV